MKKLLALVLALVMTLSLATVSTNAAFEDEKISEDYAEAVAVLNGMGVFQGDDNGKFNPDKSITRAEVATIMYRIATADTAKHGSNKAGLYASYNKFSDGNHWAAGYIGYCANAEMVKGYPDGTFKPEGKVTGYEVLVMILRAVGYDKNGEFSGADWQLNVAKVAEQLDMLDNVAKTTDLSAAASRELVAELLFRGILADKVTYTAAFGYQTEKFTKDASTIAKDNFNLSSKDYADEFGRPGTEWYNTKTDKSYAVIMEKALATYTEATKNCDIYDDCGLKKGTELDVYTNSAKADKDAYVIADNSATYGEQGRLTEVYSDRVVNIDTFLAEVTKVVAEKTDGKHTTAAYVEVSIFGLAAKDYDDEYVTDEFEKGDMVLVTVADGDIQSMVDADSKTAVLTKIAGNKKSITDIQNVMGLDKADATVNHTATYDPDVMVLGNTYNFYFDTYGNVIGADELGLNYAVMDELYVNVVKGEDTAFGTIYFFDATSKEDIEVEEIDGVLKGDFATRSIANGEYYYTVYSYTEDDGVYTFADPDWKTADWAEFRAGNKMMTSDEGALQISKNTTILLQTSKSPNGSFKAYTGYANLPSFEAYDVQYTVDANGYVDMLYAYASEFTTRTVFVYDTKPVSSEIDADGNKVATMNVLELVNGELKDTTAKIYYDFMSDDDYAAWGRAINQVGLYEIAEGEDGVWYGIREYEVHNYSFTTRDHSRVLIEGEYYDLDDAQFVKYVGTMDSGNYTTKWTAADLSTQAAAYVQYDEDGEVAVIYDLWIAKTVTVNDEETNDVEYLHRDFTTIKVELKEYEKIASATMNYPVEPNHSNAEDLELTVKYFDKDGKEVEMDAAKGTKVAYAEISYDTVVSGDVTVTTENQAAYSTKWLTKGTYNFDQKSNPQQVIVDNEKMKIEVDFKEGKVKVSELMKVLEGAKKVDAQTLVIYDTTVTNTVDGNTEWMQSCIPYDVRVRVMAWDGVSYDEYTVATYTAD